MDATTLVQSVAQKGPESKTTAPRKRRRRTATTGAADDCFTCRKRQQKCDRRRPYCSQCLEIGKDCSGYKTTLTWGVGIASRGKLRGLTCPVADTGVTKKPSVSHRRTSSAARPLPVVEEGRKRSHVQQSSLPLPAMTMSGFDPMPLLSPIDSNQQMFWQSVHQYSNMNLNVQSTSPVSDSQSVLEQSNPIDFPLTPTSLPYGDGFHSLNTQFLSNTNPCPDNGSLQAANFTNPSQSSSSYVDSEDQKQPQEAIFFNHMPKQSGPAYQGYMQSDDAVFGDFELGLEDPRQQSLMPTHNLTLSVPRSLYPTQFYHLPPRMQYLLDYYDKHICSVLVAFDDSINPYRIHILQLATQNEGLQHALAALALNNMRMRSHKRTAPRGFVTEHPDNHQDEENNSQFARPSPEESYYKSISIGRLQSQLVDMASAQDDSVLAILLILCLFHVCDSGFSKFKTQLEGVQRLLSMRDPDVRTGFIGWVEMFFAWFDVMTSTVNDRETEIQGDRLDMLHYSSNLGALEQFSGCDGRLFKLIARLGRLNLLSQNRPVRPDPKTPYPTTMPTKPANADAFQTSKGWRTRPNQDPMEFDRLDGNGWGALTTSSPADEDSDFKDPSDNRHEFWNEWHDIRSRLELWSMETPCLSPATPHPTNSQLEPGQRDLLHINESFRSSALLYTERLAHPFLPSSSPQFQTHVRVALSHIGALEYTSCVNKFLLWPLFIVGTECVDPADQCFIRDRCIEIQLESGFFNNISVLDVLERVWTENRGQEMQGPEAEEMERRRNSTGESGGQRVQAFRWRRAMDRVDGEYLVV